MTRHAFTSSCNGTKAFIDSFAIALRAELQDSGVTVLAEQHRRNAEPPGGAKNRGK